MNTVLFVNATIGFSENLFLVNVVPILKNGHHSENSKDIHGHCPNIILYHLGIYFNLLSNEMIFL